MNGGAWSISMTISTVRQVAAVLKNRKLCTLAKEDKARNLSYLPCTPCNNYAVAMVVFEKENQPKCQACIDKYNYIGATYFDDNLNR